MISVIMPVYNAAEFLRESIESILNQTEADFELIIVNDGSTDNSEDIILSYSDPRIVYVKQENAGEAAARNTALEHAKGEFIVWQDADDVSLPIRLEVLKRQFTSPSIGFTHSDMLLINDLNQPISYWQSRNISKERLLRLFLKIGTPFNNPSMMLRRKMIEGFKYDTSLRIGTDSDMVFQLSRNWDSVHVPEALYLYRRHSNNITKQLDYETVALHIRKFLERHSLQELVPELDWNNGDDTNNEARAYAIIALILSQRWMTIDAGAWLDKAQKLARGIESKLFINAVNHFINKNYEIALGLFESCPTKDHITENYMGEVCAFMGDSIQAYRHFMRALELSPQYEEPLDNLKAIGYSKNLYLADRSWMRFMCA
ncbi:MAG: glycosyltransferase [Firmicutes bacterium]|nr:glycosyltransferase [Bacillota bacterium]